MVPPRFADTENVKIVGLADSIYYVKELLTKERCQSLIEKFNGDSRKRAGQTLNSRGERKVEGNLKVTTDLEIEGVGPWQADHDELHAAVSQVVLSIAAQNPVLQTWPLRWSGYKIQHYKKNEGEFKWHVDAIGPGGWERQLAMVIYLNSVAEGGETCFFKQNIKVKPTAGDALFFPTFWTHMHCGAVPKSEDKYMISSFVTFNISQEQSFAKRTGTG